MLLLGLFGFLALFAGAFIISLLFRRVVAPNEVHIVQSSKKTTSFGKDTPNGNVYYEWPSSLPFIGIEKVILPVNVFELSIDGYEAYDQGRVPFVVDLTSFFRITDTNKAAQSVSSFEELHGQLEAIVKGAARSILASSEIEEIMEARATFGDKFTKEVASQLTEWGVSAVKNIELMDIRDSKDDIVIQNIMEKKKSLIEKESRQEVAENRKEAQLKEIDAKRQVEIEQQAANEAVGLRTVESNKAVAISDQKAAQNIKEQERLTKEKEMAVIEVQNVQTAEIQKQVQVVAAKQDKEVIVVQAEGELESAKLSAEAQLELKRKESEGIELEGSARAKAKEEMELAPVTAQITLAKEIGENQSYQDYLVTIRQVEAQQAVGIEQAKGLQTADVNIISNTESPTTGLTNVMDIFSSKGGIQVGSMLEGLSNTDTGKELLGNLNLGTKKPAKKVSKKKLNGSSNLNGSGH